MLCPHIPDNQLSVGKTNLHSISVLPFLLSTTQEHKRVLIERAELLIKEGLEQDFSNTMNDVGLAMLGAVPGILSVQFGRGVENPGKFILLIEWSSIEAHTAFSQSAVYAPFRLMLAPFTHGGSMEHFEMV